MEVESSLFCDGAEQNPFIATAAAVILLVSRARCVLVQHD